MQSCQTPPAKLPKFGDSHNESNASENGKMMSELQEDMKAEIAAMRREFRAELSSISTQQHVTAQALNTIAEKQARSLQQMEKTGTEHEADTQRTEMWSEEVVNRLLALEQCAKGFSPEGQLRLHEIEQMLQALENSVKIRTSKAWNYKVCGGQMTVTEEAGTTLTELKENLHCVHEHTEMMQRKTDKMDTKLIELSTKVCFSWL